jgi:hypothetical protein
MKTASFILSLPVPIAFVFPLVALVLSGCSSTTGDGPSGTPPDGSLADSNAVLDGAVEAGAQEGDGPNVDISDAPTDSQCPLTMPDPDAGTCQGSFVCMYGTDGALLPEQPPCAYRDVSCYQGRWAIGHNDPGTSQCGSFSFDGNYPDDCTSLGGVCIDPHIHNCPAGFAQARLVTTGGGIIACGPSPTTFCCLPAPTPTDM